MIGDALLAGRSFAESLMVDRCTVTRPGGEPVFDPSTGDYTPAPDATVYDGPCRVQTPNTQETTPQYGGREVTVQDVVVSVPASVVDAQVGDTATVTASLFDPALVGARFTVVAGERKTHATARRLRCETT